MGIMKTVSASFGSISIADRKSTRLNSSHSQISYAVFCLKKKKVVVDVDLDPQTWHDAGQAPREPPVGLAEELHHRWYQHNANDACFDEDGNGETEAARLEYPHDADDEGPEDADHDGGRRSDDTGGLRQPVGDRSGVLTFFFLNDPAPPETPPLPLHAPLPT